MSTSKWQHLDFIEHPIFVLERDDVGEPRYAAMNRFARSFNGWRPEDVVGKSAQELYPGRLGQIAYDYHDQTFKSGKPRTYELLLPFGARQKLIRTTLTPEHDADGRVIRLHGSSTDISATQVVDNVHTGMASAIGEMEDFIKLAAHDLRAPLRNVGSIAALLREDFQDLGDGKLELIDLLEAIGEKAMLLISDILSLAEISAPDKVSMIEFDFAEMVQELLTILDPWERCRVECDQALIHGDRMVTQLILRNLIDNALKTGAELLAKGELCLTLRVQGSGDGLYRLTVEDNGGGFDESNVLFLSGGEFKTGSGFGLLGVRRLVHARGGTISAGNSEDGVARIEISLPGHISGQEVPRAGLG